MEDPIEKIVREGLERAKIEFTRTAAPLDFFLPHYGVNIEVKQFFSPRVVNQLGNHSEVILIQGRIAAVAFARLINGESP